MRRDSSDFYVYVADHPVTGEPVYVGKGRGKRKDQHNAAALSGKHSNPHLANIIRKHGPLDFVVVRSGLSEVEAFETEVALIAHFGRTNNKTGSLSNKTNGGDGATGIIMTVEARAKLRAAHLGKTLTAEHRAKVSAAGKGRKYSAEVRAKMSETQRNRVLSPEAKANIIARHKGKFVSDETRKRISAAQKARPRTEADRETLRKMHAANIGVVPTKEHRAKISAALKARMLALSPEERAKIAQKHIGWKQPKEAKAKISAARRRLTRGDMDDLFA